MGQHSIQTSHSSWTCHAFPSTTSLQTTESTTDHRQRISSETEPTFPGCRSLGVMGMVQTSRCHGRYWMGGHQEKADPTRFHACVTNPFKCATCCSRSLALILRSWHSHPEARSPLCAKEFQRTDECEGIDHTYQLSSKSDMGHPRKMLSFEFQLGQECWTTAYTRWPLKVVCLDVLHAMWSIVTD